MENQTNWQRLRSPFAGRVLQDMDSILSGKSPQCCLRKSSNLLVGNAITKGNEFTERKEHSEGNQVLLPVLWFYIKTSPFQHQCHSQCHKPCAHPCCGVWGPQCSCGDTSAVGWLSGHVPRSPCAQGDTWLLLPNGCSLAEVTVP